MMPRRKPRRGHEFRVMHQQKQAIVLAALNALPDNVQAATTVVITDPERVKIAYERDGYAVGTIDDGVLMIDGAIAGVVRQVAVTDAGESQERTRAIAEMQHDLEELIRNRRRRRRLPQSKRVG